MFKIELLKKLKEKGMTQSELADKTGIRPSTICEMMLMETPKILQDI